MKKFNKNAKVEKLTKKLGRSVRLIVIGPLCISCDRNLLNITLYCQRSLIMPFHQYFYSSNRKKFKKYATPNCFKILESTKVIKQRSITFTTGLAQNALPNLTIVSDRSRPIYIGWTSCLISFVWDQSTCQERIESDKIQNEKLLSIVGHEPTTLRS